LLFGRFDAATDDDDAKVESPLIFAIEDGVTVDVSTVYSKLTAVADVGKLPNSVKQQHFTRSRPFSLPPQL